MAKATFQNASVSMSFFWTSLHGFFIRMKYVWLDVISRSRSNPLPASPVSFLAVSTHLLPVLCPAELLQIPGHAFPCALTPSSLLVQLDLSWPFPARARLAGAYPPTLSNFFQGDVLGPLFLPTPLRLVPQRCHCQAPARKGWYLLSMSPQWFVLSR